MLRECSSPSPAPLPAGDSSLGSRFEPRRVLGTVRGQPGVFGTVWERSLPPCGLWESLAGKHRVYLGDKSQAQPHPHHPWLGFGLGHLPQPCPKSVKTPEEVEENTHKIWHPLNSDFPPFPPFPLFPVFPFSCLPGTQLGPEGIFLQGAPGPPCPCSLTTSTARYCSLHPARSISKVSPF